MVPNDTVIYNKKNEIGWITLNRPDALNALNIDMLQKLSSIIDKLKTDDAIKAVIITGSGERAFSSGADIKFLNQAAPLQVRELARFNPQLQSA